MLAAKAPSPLSGRLTVRDRSGLKVYLPMQASVLDARFLARLIPMTLFASRQENMRWVRFGRATDLCTDIMTAHSRKESREQSGHQRACQNNADTLGREAWRETQDARHFGTGWPRRVRRGDKQRASPGYGERQRKVTGDGCVAESFALEGSRTG